MLELKTKLQLSKDAHALAVGNELVRYRSTTYIPADFETRDTSMVPDPKRTIWLPLSRTGIRRIAADRFDTLFASDGELASFDFMVAQNARTSEVDASELLVMSSEGLRLLTGAGQLEEPSGAFVPNTVHPMLNENAKDKARVFKVISEWLNSDEEAESLLRHLATSLAPGWSAVKYVLLIGGGRNGKSLLLKMMLGMLGMENVSTVTRLQMAEQNPVVTELNGKLLNLVFDGRSDYLKDSGTEKSLIAGELVPIRKLYESTPTIVQTNALFVEGLNAEPKSKDKSDALQKRLVRFQFPNVYAEDKRFEKLMLSEASLGAFLSLLLDRYVVEDEIAEQLALTSKARDLQLEHMYVNSLALQYLKHVVETDPVGINAVIGHSLNELAQSFSSWRIQENDLSVWAEPDILAQFAPLLDTERRSERTATGPRKIRVVVSLQDEAKAFLDSLEGADDDKAAAAVVAE